MTKVMRISVVAMLAVLPLGANAAKTAATMNLQGNAGVITPNNQMATTSYVQGAYNAVASEHNKIVNDITLTGERVEGDHISNTASVAENLEALNSAIKSLSVSSSADFVTKTTATAVAPEGVTLQYATHGDLVGQNLGSLDAQVATNATNISTLTTNTTVADDGNYISAGANVAANLGALDTQVKTNATTLGAFDEAKSHIKITNTDVFTNLHVLDAQVAANSNNINTNTNNISLNTTAIGNVSQLATAGGLIPENTDNLVDAVKAINTSLGNSNSNATISAGNYVTAGQTVGGAVAALDTAIKNNADDIETINGTIGNSAMGTTATTVTGAIAEMHGKKLTVYTTWNSDDVDEINMF